MLPSSPASVDPQSGSSALPPGERIGGHYRVLDPLGRAGGFGRTYRALDETLHREVAIKEYFPRELVTRSASDLRLWPHTPAESAAFEFGKVRFLEEGRTLARLEHPHVVRVLELFEELGTAYLVMEYHRGATLAEVAAASGGTLPEPVVAALALGALAGLEAVHAAGVVHCDVKPSNLYLTEAGAVLLLDFGAARRDLGERTATLDGVVSPGFAPFELFQERGRVGPWTDVYGVAATAVALLTGERPPSAADRMERDPLGDGEALAARLPERMRAPLLAALALRPESRTATAARLGVTLAALPAASAADLRALAERAAASRLAAAEAESGSSTTTIDGARPRRPGARRWPGVALVGAAATLALTAALYFARPRSGEPPAAAPPSNGEFGVAVADPPASPGVAAPTIGEVVLDIRPFGELIAVRGRSGATLVGPLPLALPARIRLPAGAWIAVVRSPTSRESVEVPFQVAPGAPFRVEHELVVLSARDYFQASGW